MAHTVTCQVCKEKFDRDKIAYVMLSPRKFKHASCALREGSITADQVVDPLDKVVCCYCHQEMSKSKDPFCILISNNKYAHKGCHEKEQIREKTPKEVLDAYIMEVIGTNYVPPRIQKQINGFVQEYNYTYGGIYKTMQYALNIRHMDIRSYDSLGIVPYIYNEAREYYHRQKIIAEKNKEKEILIPQIKEIIIPIPESKKRSRKFSFLDDEEVPDGIK